MHTVTGRYKLYMAHGCAMHAKRITIMQVNVRLCVPLLLSIAFPFLLRKQMSRLGTPE